MNWVWMLLGVLAETTSQIVAGVRAGKTEAELIAIGIEGAAAQSVLLAEQQRVLREAETIVEGFKVDG